MNPMIYPPLRVGIMGAAKIARKNIAAIQNQVSNCKIVAIASRSLSKANALHENNVLKEWSQNVEIIAGEDAYERLIEADGVDAVYIPLPVCVKKKWIIKALQAKKHVLCEKPVANRVSEYLEMLVVAKENNRYIMDGTMFIHNNRTNLMLEYIAQSDVFGNITRINSEFTFVGDDHFHTNNIRTTKKGDPHGCLGDLGWYCIRLAQLVFSKTKAGNAKRVQTTNWKLNDEGVPIDATCLVFFQDGDGKKNSNDEHVLSFHCSFLHPLNQRVLINGTKQSLEMKDFVIPKEGVQSWVVHGQPSFGYDSYSVQISDLLESPSGPAQEVLMWRNFSNFCRTVETKGWDDAGVVSMSNISVENQQILDALMESITLGGKSVSL